MLYRKARTSMPRSSATTTRPPANPSAQASLQQRQAGRNVMGLGARRRRIPQVEAATIEHQMAIDDVENIGASQSPLVPRRYRYGARVTSSTPSQVIDAGVHAQNSETSSKPRDFRAAIPSWV
jgi:hypothetical protein